MTTDVWTRVRAARKAAGLTQRELADALGLTRAGFAYLDSRNPKNRAVPNINQLRKVSETTRVPLHLLVSDMTTETEILRSVLPATSPAQSAAEPVSGALFNASGSKYLRKITLVDGRADVYAVLEAFNVTCPARQHAIKKLLCAGLRGKGDSMQDLREARDAVERAIQLQEAK